MTFIQRLVVTLLPQRWAEAIRAESQAWQLCCSGCGISRSVWEVGGIRYKASAVGKRTLVWCKECGQLRWMALERKPTA